LWVLGLVWGLVRVGLFVEGTPPGGRVPDQCLHEVFEARAAAAPESVAVVLGDERLTYAELDRQANQIARHLQTMGVGPEVLVGICMHRSPRRVAAVLGVLKAGGAYLPLDPASPPERVAFMLEDAGAPIVLTEQATVPALTRSSAASSWRMVRLDEDWAEISSLDGSRPASTAGNRSLAYVMYTSGSTGRPKGAAIEHRSVADFITSVTRAFDMGPSDRVLQFASLSFDTSVFEMFSALLTGATLCLATPEVALSPPLLAQLLREQRITVTDLPPAVMALLPSEGLPDLRLVLVGGETFPAELVRAWARPHRRFFNGYGPTEATVAVTLMECTGDEAPPLPIGAPMANHQAYVLDRKLNPVPVGVPGELYVGGAGLARGYVNRPELTRERFIPNPFGSEPGDRVYKTGDIACYLPDGTLQFLGRIDDQVKVAGVRVELGEIQATLAAHPGVRQAAVITWDAAPGQRQLAAYLTVNPAAPPERAELRQHLARHLPAYMIPSHFMILDALPLNASGKLDRSALPAPGLETGGDVPQTLVEAALAELFAEVLGVQQVGANDDFFDLGGTSLQAMRLLARLRDSFDLGLDVTVIFQAPTVGRLAQLLRSEHGVADEELDGDQWAAQPA
jgi:amino acid adenylation domain-containing protein